MIKRLMLAAAFATAFAAPSFAAMTAQEFVDKAGKGGMFEVEAAEVALGAAKSEPVKTAAQMIHDDHMAANGKLKTVAAEEKLTLPTELDAEQRENVEKLKSAGDAIDTTYAEMMVEDHAKDIELFETYAKEGDNQALIGFANAELPVLRKHHEMVKGLAAK